MEKWWIPCLNKEIYKGKYRATCHARGKKKGILESQQKDSGANLNGLSLTKDGAI